MPENGVRTRKIAFPVLKILGNTEEENREHLEKNELKNGVRTQKKSVPQVGNSGSYKIIWGTRSRGTRLFVKMKWKIYLGCQN